MNEKIIENLKNLVIQLKIQKENKYRIRAIENAITILKAFREEIISVEQLNNTPGIGDGILRRVSEILQTGYLSELNTSDEYKHFQEQVGIKTANELIERGITSLSLLKQAVEKGIEKIDHRLSLILKYACGDIQFKENIPRKEMKKTNKLLESLFKNYDTEIKFKMCGSFRRKKDISNDIDILIFRKDNKVQLGDIIKYLSNKGFLADHITYKLDDLKTVYRGYSNSVSEKMVVRRIDIRFIKYKSRATALLYFTGSKLFNIYIRGIAKKRGYKLNEYYIEKDSKRMYPRGEKDIFSILHLDYVKPEKRN